jgi:hypothetical protein
LGDSHYFVPLTHFPKTIAQPGEASTVALLQSVGASHS